ncbi:hypothetical protein TKK_0001263 [Trichogramma kaykai]|uniref:Protein Malvolio n=1 Tax=Trichogramma kaykai TaxID=54128 RepID=A0ABD2WWP8_9HYME
MKPVEDRPSKNINNDMGNNSLGDFGEQKIDIPELENHTSFSFRKLWAFMGPGFLMSIAFLDPGNIESDLQSGVTAQYKLIWLLLGATCLGLIMQRLSSRLGVVSGLHLAEMCYRQFRKTPRILLWLMTEIAITGSDMQEVIGTSIALYLLTSKWLPLWAGVLLTIIDTFTFMYLDKYGMRKVELLFGIFIGIMALTFGYEYVVSAPPQGELLKGMFTPWCSNCSTRALIQAVGLIGANIQPHNLYFHSALVKSRKIDRTKPNKVHEACMYYFTEASIALFLSFLINLFVMCVFAHGLYNKSNADVYATCKARNFSWGLDEFLNNAEPFEADLYKGGIFLGCSFGFTAMIIWAIGILAAGQSSTMTGSYTGQFVMEGFLNLKWPRWRRIVLTRSIAIVPTFFIAFFSSIEQLTGLNDILNVTMSLQLPFAALPLIAFTSSANVMGDFKNGLFNKVASTFLSLFVIGINFFLVATFLREMVAKNEQPHAMVFVAIGVVGFLYLLFCLYLLAYLACAMGASSMSKIKFIAKYVTGPQAKNLEVVSRS